MRTHIRVGAEADKVWAVLRDVPAENYDAQVTSSTRSKDGSIIRENRTMENTTRDVRGELITATIYYKVVERDDQLRRLRLKPFAAEGTYDVLRPAAGGDWTLDVLDDRGGCLVVISAIDIPDARLAIMREVLDSQINGLKAFCENEAT